MGAPAGRQSKVPQIRRASDDDVIPAMAQVRAGHRQRVTFFLMWLEKLRFSDRVCSLFSENVTRDGAFVFEMANQITTRGRWRKKKKKPLFMQKSLAYTGPQEELMN